MEPLLRRVVRLDLGTGALKSLFEPPAAASPRRQLEQALAPIAVELDRPEDMRERGARWICHGLLAEHGPEALAVDEEHDQIGPARNSRFAVPAGCSAVEQ